MTGLQQIPHCLLVNTGEDLSVYLTEEGIRKPAEGLCGCKRTCSAHHAKRVAVLTLHELIEGVGLGDILYTPSKQVVWIDNVQGSRKFDSQLVGEFILVLILARHKGRLSHSITRISCHAEASLGSGQDGHRIGPHPLV